MSNVAGANIKLNADESGVISGLNNARKQFALFTREINSNVTQAYKAADAQQKIFRSGLTRLGDDITSIGKKMAVVGTLPALFAAGKAYKDYADIQRMEKGLALYGSTLEDIRRLAKEPNIGVFDGSKSLIGLRAAKVEAGLAERAVRSFANAIAAAGGNAADLEPALLNLKQFKATKNINQVDLRQLSARIPQAQDIIEKTFGTLDTEKLNKIGIDKFIEGFVSGLEKIPKVAGGAGVAMEQVTDSFTFFSATVGEGVDKAFGVTAKLKSLGGFLDDLATGFKKLSPEAQKAILVVGGLAVVVPALTVAVGGLIAAWPLLAAGFAAISWPVVGVIAATTAIAGLVLLFGSASEGAKDLAQQQEMVSSFSSKLDPLIAKYEELKNKTTLTAEEQKTLKDVTKQIAELAPTAATAWDKYGNAVDISTGKVKTHTEEQRKLLLAMQATRRETLLAENRSSLDRRKELGGLLNPETATKRVNVGMGQYVNQSTKLASSDIQKYSAELAQLNAQEVANRKELLSLGGTEAYQKETIALRSLIAQRVKLKGEYANALKGKDFNLQESIRIEKASVENAIKEREENVKLLGSQMTQARRELRATSEIIPAKGDGSKTPADDAKETAAAYKEMSAAERAIWAIDLSMKFDKDRDALKAKIKEYKEYYGVIAGLELAMQKPIGSTLGGSVYAGSNLAKARTSHALDRRIGEDMRANKESANSNSAVRDSRYGASLGLKSVVGDAAKLGDIQKYFESIPLKAGESATAYQERINSFVDASAQLNAGLTGSLKEAAGNAAVGFGEMLGNLMSGVGGVEGFYKNVMGRIGALLKDLGKSLIGFGTAGIALKVFAKNPALAIAAGVALTALGQVAMNSAKGKTEQATRRFAKGGMAFKEMSAIIGDNPNARFDPEIVAPYSKIHDSIQKSVNDSGGGSGNIIIPEVQIRGADLYLIYKRQQEINKGLGIG